MSADNSALLAPSAPPSQRSSSAANPFPGLRPFGASEAGLFFWRREHVEALLAKLQRQRLLAVVGTSGSGKSSLVLAGILPRLDRGYQTATGTSWRIVTMRPGSDPIAHLASALQSVRERDDEQSYSELLSAYDGRSSGTRLEGVDAALDRDLLRIDLERSSNGLLEAVRNLELGPGENLLLVVDQFEELFRFHRLMQGQVRDVAAAFVKLLLRASEQQQLPIYVMLTLRSRLRRTIGLGSGAGTPARSLPNSTAIAAASTAYRTARTAPVSSRDPGTRLLWFGIAAVGARSRD